MKIKDILQKIAKGEELTDDEKKFLEAFDPDAVAASARKKAESDAKKAIDEAAKLKTDLEKAQADLAKAQENSNKGKSELELKIEALSQTVKELTKAKEKSDAEAARLSRSQKIAAIRKKHGINFIDGVDPAITDGAFERIFDGIDGLDDEDIVKLKVTEFRDANKALIADSGHGSGGGNPADIKTQQAVNMPIEDRAKQLEEEGIIHKGISPR